MIGDQYIVIAPDHCEGEMVIVNNQNKNIATVPLVHIKLFVTVLEELTVQSDYNIIDDESF